MSRVRSLRAVQGRLLGGEEFPLSHKHETGRLCQRYVDATRQDTPVKMDTITNAELRELSKLIHEQFIQTQINSVENHEKQ